MIVRETKAEINPVNWRNVLPILRKYIRESYNEGGIKICVKGSKLTFTDISYFGFRL